MNTNYLSILKREIAPALGCTEPSAIALAVAKSKEILNKPVELVELFVSGNILKNAMGVGIPGTDMVGIEIAAALSCIAGNSMYALEVLKDIKNADIEKAREMVQAKKIKVYIEDTTEKLYIKAVCHNGDNSASTVIKKNHTDIVSVCYNDEFIFIKEDDIVVNKDIEYISNMNVRDIYHFAMTVEIEELEFLQETIDMNSTIAKEGLTHKYGMGVGIHMYESSKSQGMENDLASYAVALTAAAADARMAGCILPVMSTTGSGNQGLTATLPIIAIAEKLGKNHENLLRALALSILVTIHIKGYIGKLSALCGCAIAASIGSSCGITYLMGGHYLNILYAIKNMIADVSGLICDGAKPGCALKIATSVSGAMQCAVLAINNVEASDKDGIIDECVEKTIQNLGDLGNNGMQYTDQVILNMMVSK